MCFLKKCFPLNDTSFVAFFFGHAAGDRCPYVDFDLVYDLSPSPGITPFEMREHNDRNDL
jgi:hypothetical protein